VSKFGNFRVYENYEINGNEYNIDPEEFPEMSPFT
jgi:hypothetical protein